MAKGKKKNKKNSFYKSIKPYISDNRVLFSLLGAAAAGVALAAVVGTDKGKEMIDKVAMAAKDFTNTARNGVASKNTSTQKQPA